MENISFLSLTNITLSVWIPIEIITLISNIERNLKSISGVGVTGYAVTFVGHAFFANLSNHA